MANPFLAIDPRNLTDVLVALVNTSSVSREEKQICDYLEEWIPKFRPDAKLIRFSNTLIVQVEADNPSELPIILAGHTDTVPEAQYNGESNAQASITDGRIYGLGTADMKSGVAVMIALLADISIPSTFIFYEAEEIEEKYNGLRLLNEAHPELLKGKWAVLLEPTDSSVELGCQGALTLKAIYRGVRAHSARPWMGENAIHKAADAISRVEQLSKSLPQVEINGLTYPSTLQLTRINGGVASNVIPDECSLVINHRYSPYQSEGEAAEFIKSKVVYDADEVIEVSNIRGAEPAFDHPLVEHAKQQGKTVISKVAWTDVARFFALGIPALNCGPGHPELCHRADENIEIKKLEETYNFLKDFLS